METTLFIHSLTHAFTNAFIVSLVFNLALGTMTPSQDMISAARSLHFDDTGRSAVRISVRCAVHQLSKMEKTREPRQEASVKETG